MKIIKKAITLLCCAVLSSVGFTSMAFAESSNNNSSNSDNSKIIPEGYEMVTQETPYRITVLGDSIATGYGLDNYNKDDITACASYANILALDYKLVSEVNYYNKAVDGYTTQNLLSHLNSKTLDMYLGSDVIILSIGGNDFLGRLINFITTTTGETNLKDAIPKIMQMEPQKLTFLGMSLGEELDAALESYMNDFPEIIKYIKSINPDANIIVQTLYNPLEKFEQFEAIKTLSKAKISLLNEVITGNTTDENGKQLYRIADIASAFSDKADKLTNISQMDIHPNADGHAVIAEIIDKVVHEQTYSTLTEKAVAPNSDTESEQITSNSSRRMALLGITFLAFMILLFVFAILIKRLKEN